MNLVVNLFIDDVYHSGDGFLIDFKLFVYKLNMFLFLNELSNLNTNNVLD